ncbi:MAG TPA: SDR family oxidoreductase [Candidatus Baltobacteraceae bacterium]|jgi:3-oxoacyl-[acyl-carrier protein] reductase|nr:SDR family oxidoreductase [Candidatus Baltobacteraceae bacterium]
MRRALVTGAAGGLAAGIASVLARDGFERITITYRNASPEATLAAIASTGTAGAAARIDFSASEREIEDALASVAAEHGPFDTLVHAVGPIVIKRFSNLTASDYREIFDGNVRSAVLTAHAVLPAMREARFGRIVYFGSLGANETRPYRGFSFYQAAKSALVAFARCLAVEEAHHGITVNVVVPGDIRQKSLSREAAREITAPNPLGRAGSYEDVADAVRFLIAPERDFVTGAVLDVTGGLTQADERNEPRS